MSGMKSAVKILSKDKISRELEQYDYEIGSISYLNETSNKKSPRAVLNSYKILVMLQGQASIHIDRSIYYTSSGDCVIFAPGSLYHAEISEEEKCRFIAINFNISSPVQSRKFENMLGLKGVAIFQGIIPADITNQLMAVYAAAAAEEDGCYYRTMLMLKKLVGLMTFNSHSRTQDKTTGENSISREQTVLKCHRYIINNPETAVTVDMLCEECSVSQSYLYKCFRKVLGVSTKDFITKTKLDMAARSLLQTDKTIVNIARENGYSNSYRFSNIFKKAYGMSPSAYRKENR